MDDKTLTLHLSQDDSDLTGALTIPAEDLGHWHAEVLDHLPGWIRVEAVALDGQEIKPPVRVDTLFEPYVCASQESTMCAVVTGEGDDSEGDMCANCADVSYAKEHPEDQL